MNFMGMLRAVFPIFRFIVSRQPLIFLKTHLYNDQPSNRGTQTKIARQTMSRIGNQLLKESHTAIRAENDVVEKSSWKRKDLLSLLMRANMATDLPPSQRVADSDVLAR